MAAFDEAPLKGMQVVVTRSEERAEGMVERLRALGAEPLVYPTIAFAPPEDAGPLERALRRLVEGEFDWLVLTSVTAVQFVAAGLAAFEGSIGQVGNVKVAAVGPTTALVCSELLGVTPALVPERFVAEALAERLGALQGQRVLLANADIARPTLEERLSAAGAIVERVVAYRTVPATGGDDVPGLLRAGAVGAVMFTSGSTVRYFVQRIGPEALEFARQAIVACIGPSTATVAHEVGLPPTIVAETSTQEGLVEALVAFVAQMKSERA